MHTWQQAWQLGDKLFLFCHLFLFLSVFVCLFVCFLLSIIHASTISHAYRTSLPTKTNTVVILLRGGFLGSVRTFPCTCTATSPLSVCFSRRAARVLLSYVTLRLWHYEWLASGTALLLRRQVFSGPPNVRLRKSGATDGHWGPRSQQLSMSGCLFTWKTFFFFLSTECASRRRCQKWWSIHHHYDGSSINFDIFLLLCRGYRLYWNVLPLVFQACDGSFGHISQCVCVLSVIVLLLFWQVPKKHQ